MNNAQFNEITYVNLKNTTIPTAFSPGQRVRNQSRQVAVRVTSPPGSEFMFNREDRHNIRCSQAI